jgi:predicted small integral membrane protein
MNHQPFDDWLLEDENLTVQQKRELEVHLRSCTSCSAIAASNLALRTKHLAMPQPGFTERFRPRLAAWKKEQLRRQAIGTIVLVAAGLALLYAVAGPAMVEAARSPAAWMRDVTVYVLSLFTLASVAGQVGSVVLRSVVGLIPPGAWWAATAGGFGLAVMCTVVMRRSFRAPQGV